jgi:hypothetical protein
MASRWYCRAFDQERGPISFQELVEMVREGTLTGDDRVRRESSKEWTRAREVIGLFRAAQMEAAGTKTPEPEPTPIAPAAGPSLPDRVVAMAPEKVLRRQRRMPQIGAHLWISAGLVLMVAAIVGFELWSHRKSRVFPESAMKRFRPADRQLLEVIRPPKPKVPSIPGLEEGVAKPIPGLETIEPGYSPCLSPDLKTIVYAHAGDWVTDYDLYIARRDEVSAPFSTPELIRSSQSPVAEYSPTLSPDGLELIFARSVERPQFFHAKRETASAEFGEPVLWKIPDYDVDKKQRVERPQFLDSLNVMFCFIDMASNTRRVLVAGRSRPRSSLGPPRTMPFSDAWPGWFVSADGSRAYYGTEEGLFVAARHSASETFGEPVTILGAKDTGPFDGPIWVAPQEDVVFYASNGPGKKAGLAPGDKGRKLWMMRF